MTALSLLYALLTLLTLQATTSWSIPRLQGVHQSPPPATQNHHQHGNDGDRKRLHPAGAARVSQDSRSCAFSLETMALSAIIGLTALFTGPAASFSVDPPPTAAAANLRHHQQQPMMPLAQSPFTMLARPPAGLNRYQSQYSLPSITLSAADDHGVTALLDEVWTLIDKYYIDRSFGGNDWNKVRDKYTPLVQNAKDEGTRYHFVTEMVGTLGDKYSRMLDPSAYVAIQKYDLIGVGMTLMPNDDKDIIVGAPPVAGSEADRVGIRQGDFITAINGIRTKDKSAFDIIDQIADDPNSKSISMAVRSGNDPTPGSERIVTMQRSLQKVQNPVLYKVSEIRRDGTKVGYIKIMEFNSLVKGNLENALADLEAQGVNAYVLDVRQNTGGAFQSAVEIAGLFAEDKIATWAVDSSGTRLAFRTPKGKLAVDKSDPLVIWIDGRSASASEVLAASLRDNCRATIMGQQSFGKGLIQAVYGLKNGAGLVLTVARYETPAGNDIQGVGIKPDFGTELLPFGPFGLGTDTSKVDFVDAKKRVTPPLCSVPTG